MCFKIKITDRFDSVRFLENVTALHGNDDNNKGLFKRN